MIADKKDSGSPYQELVAAGYEFLRAGNMRKATKKLDKAIRLDPEQPHAYAALSQVMEATDLPVSAALAIKAVERSDPNSCMWARNVTRAFDSIRMIHNDIARPTWWNDEDLLAMSARVLSVIGHENNHMAHLMRARVLCHGAGVTSAVTWEAQPRTARQLMEASQSYQLVAEYWPTAFPEESQQFVELAHACLGCAMKSLMMADGSLAAKKEP